MREILTLLERALGGLGSFALIEGEPGSGRSELLRAVARRARHADVYAASGSEYERGLPLGVARELFAPLLGEQSWPRTDSPILADDCEHGPGSQAPPLELHLILDRLAAAGPVVLIVDDIQWADEDSIGLLAYLGRRAQRQRLLLLVSLRTADRDGVTALRPLLPPALDAQRIALAPLGRSSVERLTAKALGEQPASAFASAAHAATAGNPALVRWLLAALARNGVAPREDEIARIAQCTPPELHDWLRGRIAALPSGAQSFAEALTVLEDGASLADIGALAELEAATVAKVADALVAAGILASTSKGFAQPMIRSAIARAIPTGRLALLHRHAARISGDLMNAATHVRMTPALGDPHAAATLTAAGERARSEGATETAALLWRRALAEPPPEGERAALLLALGRVEASLGDPGALERLAAAHRATTDSAARSAIVAECARILHLRDQPAKAARLLLAELDSLPRAEIDRAVMSELESELCLLATTSARRLVLDRTRRVVTRVRRGGRDEDPALLAAVSAELSLRAPAATAVEIARRSLSDPGIHQRGGTATSTALMTLVFGECFDEAATGYDAAIARARDRGSSVEISYLLAGHAWLRLCTGGVVEAEVEARDGLCGSLSGRPDAARAARLAALVGALTERGESEAALRVSDEAEDVDAAETSIFSRLLLTARARALAAVGSDGPALRLLTAQRQWARRENVAHPALTAACDLALVTARLGRRQEAWAVAQEALASTRRLGLATAGGVALRVAGVVADDLEVGVALLREAAAVLESGRCRLEHARALVDLGAVLRRGGHRGDARLPLARGRDIADRCGATALERRAHAELLVAGGRPRRVALHGVDSLTPAEQRVARFAADGLSNRDISNELFVSRKTVEMHLSRVYDKLGVRARSGLSALLSDDTAPRSQASASA